jgi:hypothetical protein
MDLAWKLQREEEEKLKKSKAKRKRAKKLNISTQEIAVSEPNYVDESESEQKHVQPFSTQADTMNFLSTRILL